MKKFLKVIFIIILVCLSIGGTAYLFYKRLHPKVNYFNELEAFYSGAAEQEFESDLSKVVSNTLAAGDFRFSLISTTNGKLNDCLKNLASYYVVADNYNIHGKKISDSLSALKSARSQTKIIMDAYLSKTTAQGSLSLGANDTYDSFANYFVQYAKFINVVNEELATMQIDRNADLKFSVIEVYCDVCINTYSNLNTALLHNVSNSVNINAIGGKIKFKNSFLDLGEKGFSYLNNSFIKYYNLSDKADFAKNLSANMRSGRANSATNELLAGYYLNRILGD